MSERGEKDNQNMERRCCPTGDKVRGVVSKKIDGEVIEDGE